MQSERKPKHICALEGVPAGVKFSPTEQELLEHLAGKISKRSHPLIDEFIPELEGGICDTHPENLPGVSRDGRCCYFFHRATSAYPKGTRKRRKVGADDGGGCWHKTGNTKRIDRGKEQQAGWKKILVLYKYKKSVKQGGPNTTKTNWVMHQYHIGDHHEEGLGDVVVSKVFYQTDPRGCKKNTETAEYEASATSRPAAPAGTTANKATKNEVSASSLPPAVMKKASENEASATSRLFPKMQEATGLKVKLQRLPSPTHSSKFSSCSAEAAVQPISLELTLSQPNSLHRLRPQVPLSTIVNMVSCAISQETTVSGTGVHSQSEVFPRSRARESSTEQ